MMCPPPLEKLNTLLEFVSMNTYWKSNDEITIGCNELLSERVSSKKQKLEQKFKSKKKSMVLSKEKILEVCYYFLVTLRWYCACQSGKKKKTKILLPQTVMLNTFQKKTKKNLSLNPSLGQSLFLLWFSVLNIYFM